MESPLDNSPFLSHMGLKLTHWEEGLAHFEMEIAPWQLNRQGVLQGGVVATLLDAVCGYAGLYSGPGQPRVNGFTISLSVDFVASSQVGKLRAIGTKIGGGKQIFFSRGEISAEDGRLIASGQGSFKYRRST